MRSHRLTKYLAGLVMIVIVIPGALLVSTAVGRTQDKQDDTARKTSCEALIDTMVKGLDTFTRQFDGLPVLGTDKIPPMPSMPQLRDEAAGLERQLERTDCPTKDARDAVAKWRQDEGAQGPLAEGVRSALAANVIDVLDGNDSPERHVLGTGEDLETVLSGLPSGATLVLPAGEFELDRTVAFVQDITIEGAGADRTTISSRAQGVGLALASQVAMRVSGVRLTHAGGGTASVLLLRAGSAELENVQVSGATRDASAAKAGGGVLSGGSGIVLAGGLKLRMLGSQASHNAVGGLLVATGTPQVRQSTFRGNKVCGVCYVGNAKGRLLASVVVGNGAGVMLGDRSGPVIEGNRIERNKQAGLVIEAGSRPMVRDNRIRANGGIGAAIYAKASPRLVGNRISGHRQAGILVDVQKGATPRLEKNTLRDNGSAGLVLTGRSGGLVAGNVCVGGRFGLVLDASAAPVLRGNNCMVQDQRR